MPQALLYVAIYAAPSRATERVAKDNLVPELLNKHCVSAQVGLLSLTDRLVFFCTGIQLCTNLPSNPSNVFSALYASKVDAKGRTLFFTIVC